MAMGERRKQRQQALWVETAAVKAPNHPFYKRLNKILDKHGVDEFTEELCAQFYADQIGRPSLPPAVYFRLLLIGYFEGIAVLEDTEVAEGLSDRVLTELVADKGYHSNAILRDRAAAKVRTYISEPNRGRRN